MSIISEIARIEEACFNDAWSEASLEDTFKHEYNHLVAVFDDGSIADDFVFQGSKKWQLTQIGNAVPCYLGKAIGLSVEKMLNEEKMQKR